jgi:hypothetical protein
MADGTPLTARMDMAGFRRAFSWNGLRCVADVMAVLVAVSLPWSTSATGILTGLWVVALLPTLDIPSARRVSAMAAAWLPAALCALAVVGVLWADAPMAERLGGLKSFWRLLMIPFLLIQFQRSSRGAWVLVAYLAACTALLIYSYILTIFPSLPHSAPGTGVPVKDYVVQSGEFLICAFGLAHVALCQWRARRPRFAIASAILALAFLANIAFVATGRTTVVVFCVLVVVFSIQRWSWKRAVAVSVIGAALLAAALASSSYLRMRVLGVGEEIRRYETENAETSTGFRLEFWKKSIGFFVASPIIGHGTGSTEELFRRAKVGTEGISSTVTGNPHSQFLLIAVELGVVGVALMVAMWLAHGLLFRGDTLPAYLGLGIVVQNVVASIFNAQLFYFTPGWTYVFGVGVLGGMVLAAREKASRFANEPRKGGFGA